MKNRGIVATGLIFVLALAAAAQQTSSSSGAAASSQSVSSSSAASSGTGDVREPLTSPKPTNFWDGDDPNLVNLVTHPFANKKYVQRQTAPIRDRINELDEITSENATRIKDVDARAQKGIQMASEKSSVADQHASDAANKAQLAQTAATDASTRVSSAEQMVGSLDQYKGTAQTEIRFRPGQNALSKSAKDALDEMVVPLKGQKSYIIEVHGFSSGHGQAAISSSAKMADSVVRYLVETHDIPVFRIYVLSMGNVPASGEAGKHVVGGRVEVSVLKNDVMASAK